MTVGIILLSPDGFYLDADGFLPQRPEFDKELLTGLCKGQEFVCSESTFVTLPDSILKNGYYTDSKLYDINLGIKTLYTMPPHLLIVVRSDKRLNDGKYFDIGHRYKRVFASDNLELWIKN